MTLGAHPTELLESNERDPLQCRVSCIGHPNGRRLAAGGCERRTPPLPFPPAGGVTREVLRTIPQRRTASGSSTRKVGERCVPVGINVLARSDVESLKWWRFCCWKGMGFAFLSVQRALLGEGAKKLRQVKF